MKVAHVLTRFSPGNMGGVERVVEGLSTRQMEDMDVEIICRNEFNEPPHEEYKGIDIRRAYTADLPGLGTLSSLVSMARCIRDSNADIYHIHDWSPFLNYVFAGMPGKSVLTLHNLAPADFRSRLEGFAVNRCDESVAVSSWLCRELNDRHGRHSRKLLKPIANGVELGNFNIGSDRGYALFVGRLEEVKGVREVCQVFENLEKELKVVGTGSLEEELRNRFSHEFLGYVPEQKLKELYSGCSYLVCPSRKEGFGLVWAEALASGKPVVCTNTGQGEKIPKHCGQRISSEFKISDLKDAVKSIEKRDIDSGQIRRYAEEEFDWNAAVKQYKAVYNAIHS